MSTTKQIVSLTKGLVKFKTTSDNIKEISNCANFIIKYFKNNKNVKIKKYNINKKPAIILTFRNTKKPELLLLGHYDVVPGGKEQFKPRVAGNRIYGRGAGDNKSAVASLMVLMQEYSTKKEKPDIGVMLTPDEETGGASAKALVARYGYRCNFAIVPDAGSGAGGIVIKEKGILKAKVIARGKSAHGARPWKGVNAIEKIAEAYPRIKKLFPKTTKGNRWKTTVCPVKINGGDVLNKVPDYAEMWLDIRFTDLKGVKSIVKRMKKIKGVRIEAENLGEVLDTNKNNPYLKKLKKSVQRIIKKSEFEFEHGASDARHLARKGIPSALIAPKTHGVHAEKEYVEIKSLEPFYNILKDFIDRNIRKI